MGMFNDFASPAQKWCAGFYSRHPHPPSGYYIKSVQTLYKGVLSAIKEVFFRTLSLHHIPYSNHFSEMTADLLFEQCQGLGVYSDVAALSSKKGRRVYNLKLPILKLFRHLKHCRWLRESKKRARLTGHPKLSIKQPGLARTRCKHKARRTSTLASVFAR